MKDLKHLLYFENLLQEAHNDLIAQAQNEGKICVAYACENTPEPLLNLPGAFSTRLRAPRTGSMEMATYYMTSFLCEYSRALLERAIEGGYNFADCMITPDGCSMMNRAVENMELLKTMGKDKPKFFFEYMEIPMKADDNGLNLYVLQCRNPYPYAAARCLWHRRLGRGHPQSRRRAQPRVRAHPRHRRVP